MPVVKDMIQGEAKVAKKSSRKDKQVKIDENVALDAQFVALDRGISLAKYLTDILAPVVAKDIAEVWSKRSKGQSAKGGK